MGVLVEYDVEVLNVAQRAASAVSIGELEALGAELEFCSAELNLAGKGYDNWVYGSKRPYGPQRFTWGRVIKVHSVGGYQIVESQRNAEGPYDPLALKDQPLSDDVSFHAFVDGRDLGHSWSSLDQALLGCIAWRYELRNWGSGAALNSRAVSYISRMLGMGEEG